MKTYNQFQREVAAIWRANGQPEAWMDQNIIIQEWKVANLSTFQTNDIVRRFSHEIGKAGNRGGHMAMVSYAWMQYKNEYQNN